MRLPRVQFTINRVMLAVAVVALIIGGSRIVLLRDSYQKAAAHFAITENLYRSLQRFAVEQGTAEEELALAFGEKVSVENRKQRAAEVRAFQQQIEYYAALRRKYQRSAARPWVPVDPDPNPPIP